MWAVKHPQHEEVIVKAPDRLRSISAAAHIVGRPLDGCCQRVQGAAAGAGTNEEDEEEDDP